ncbi:MAG: CBS domain-containing protein [Bacteroidota bacterium]
MRLAAVKEARYFHCENLNCYFISQIMYSFIVAKYLTIPNPPKITAEDSLSTALSLFTATGVDELPVVDGSSGVIRGVIRKKDLLMAYDRELVERKGMRKSCRSKVRRWWPSR